MKKDEIIKYLLFLYYTKTGLRAEELLKLSTLASNQITILNLYLEPFLTTFNNRHKLIDRALINYIKNFARTDQKGFFYKYIADSINPLEKNERNIKERTNGYFISQDYFTLKKILGSIEEFLIFFKTENKLEIYRYWSALSKQNYDPVIEYIKSVENFVMHYHPKSQDLFKLVVQLSRFFVDLAEFEGNEILEFRRPKLINRVSAIKIDYNGDNFGDQYEKNDDFEEDIGTVDDSVIFRFIG